LQEVVAYFGIRAFADDVRFERDEGLGRATVVALKKTLWHKWHSDQVETRDQNNRNQEQLARPGEYRRRMSRRIHVHGLRQLLVLFIHNEGQMAVMEGAEVAEKVVEA
jgi:hypothetical protein